MNAWGSMAMRTCGRSSLTCSITCPWLLLFKSRFSVSTVASHLRLIPLIRSVSWIASKRCPMRVPSAICSGLTPTTDAVGVSLLVVPAIRSVRTSQSNLTMRMDWQELPVPISLWWMVTIGVTSATLWLSSRHPTIATDAAMRLPSVRSTSTWIALCKYTTLHLWQRHSLMLS